MKGDTHAHTERVGGSVPVKEEKTTTCKQYRLRDIKKGFEDILHEVGNSFSVLVAP